MSDMTQAIITAAHELPPMTWERAMLALSERFDFVTPAKLADALLAAGRMTEAECDAVHGHGFDFDSACIPNRCAGSGRAVADINAPACPVCGERFKARDCTSGGRGFSLFAPEHIP